MLNPDINKPNILYVFGGEKAQGAEIVIERLMSYNAIDVNTHLILSPGTFANVLIKKNKPYKINTLDQLKKLNRSSTGKFQYVIKALKNYVLVPWKVLKYVRQNNIHILHANTVVPASYLLPLVWYCKLFRPSLKCCWSDHDMKYLSNMDMILSKLCAKAFHYTLVVSAAVKRKYPENEKVIILYNGLDTSQFSNDPIQRSLLRTKFNIDEQSQVIGLAAAINPDKGQLPLINVFNRVNSVFPESRLFLAGGYASHFPEYGKMVAEEIEKNKNIIYGGFISCMSGFYNCCDIVINNSNNTRSESLGTTIYEAMACSCLVLASDTGGTSEIITDKADGYLFEPENETDLYDHLSFLLENYNKLNKIRTAARKKVESKFNIEVMVAEYNSILNIRMPGKTTVT